MKKALVHAPFMPIPANLSSHRGAQGAMYADMLRGREFDVVDVNWSGRRTNYNDYDLVYLYHGNDYNGQPNLFGDVFGYPYAYNIESFFNSYRGECVSLGIPCPDYHGYLVNKIRRCYDRGKKPMREFVDLDMENVRRICETSTWTKFPVITDKLVIGDSHSICMYRPGWTVNSVPFKTLNGALSSERRPFWFDEKMGDSPGLQGFYDEVTYDGLTPQINEVEFYFGNIDVRHHLCRLFPHPADRDQGIFELTDRYVDQVRSVMINPRRQVIRAAIYELLPIEDESRKVPKTGYFQGRPFWGSWSERNDARLTMNSYLKRKCASRGIEFIEWTKYLQNPRGALDFKYMEKPHSIHLSREHYPYWKGEDGRPFIASIGPRRGDYTRIDKSRMKTDGSLEGVLE